jgi:glycosyltransferase involved in cell wall biosynthesis
MAGVTPKIVRELREIIKINKFEIIFFNTSLFGNLIKKLKLNNSFTITFFHNIEINFYKSWYRNAGTIRKIWYFTSRQNILKSERNAVLYSKKIITINGRDAHELDRIYHRQSDFIFPVTFYDKFDPDIALKYSKKSPNKELLFVGSDFPANTDGLFWFIENCIDDINAHLIIVGGGMDKYKNRYSQKKVSFLGYVDDIAEYYYRADAVVLPILSGSGMKTKTCEALMYGKTIFGTHEAFEGYDALDYKNNGWLCNSADDFIATINNYLLEQREKANQYARDIFLTNYSSNMYETKLYDFINLCRKEYEQKN